MCDGEVATVCRAVRSAYDVLKGSVRARRGNLTMGGCLKPYEDRKRRTSETMEEFEKSSKRLLARDDVERRNPHPSCPFTPTQICNLIFMGDHIRTRCP